jgi:hypothetical protein
MPKSDSTKKSGFTLGSDPDKLKEDFLKVGFKNVKLWY